jgi:hypothetical protein
LFWTASAIRFLLWLFSLPFFDALVLREVNEAWGYIPKFGPNAVT